MGSLLDSTKQLFSRQPSDPQEIKDSREARNKLKAYLEQTRKDYLNAIQQNKSKGFQEKDFDPIKTRIQKTQTWINSNLRPFAQDSLDQIDILREDIKDLYLTIAEKGPQKKEDDLPPPIPEPIVKAWEDKSISEVFYDAAKISFYIFITVLLLGICIRAGAFSANQSIHLAAPYRILNFVYGTLLPIYTIPYYTYQWIRSRLGYRESLIMESAIPIYETNAPVDDLLNSTFTWFRSPELSARIDQLKANLNEEQAKALEVK